jgi:hypothetical protein
MEVTLRQKGGFAGTSAIIAKATAEPARVRPLLERMKELAEKHNPVGADLVRYELSIKDSGSEMLVSFADDDSDTARQLMDLANKIAAR